MTSLLLSFWAFLITNMATLEKQVTSDSPKCLTVTITDGNNWHRHYGNAAVGEVR